MAGPLTGLGIERFGIGCVPWLMTAVSAVCLLLVLHLARATRTTHAVHAADDVYAAPYPAREDEPLPSCAQASSP